MVRGKLKGVPKPIVDAYIFRFDKFGIVQTAGFINTFLETGFRSRAGDFKNGKQLRHCAVPKTSKKREPLVQRFLKGPSS
jgi:hypothetical protein